MKKFRFISFLFLMIMSLGILCSCGGEQWPVGPQGEQGPQGPQGEQGIQGQPGEDGHTPVITIGNNGNWFIDGVDTNVNAQGDQGIQGEPGEDGRGIVSITLTETNGDVDTYTITYSDNTTSTFIVTNGQDGQQGIQGQPGEDGHTPVITIGNNGNWFIDGVDTNVNAQGDQGIQGEPGEQGLSAYEIFKKYYPEYTGTEQEWITDVALGNKCNLFGHVWDNGTITKEPTYTNSGERTYECTICNELRVEEEPKYDSDYLEIYEENGMQYVNFGLYPKTLVVDQDIIESLSVISDTNQNGYYVYDENQYIKFEDSYYLVEPIKWRVISKDDNKILVLSENVLDIQQFTSENNTVKYENSKVRTWLNSYFINQAFNNQSLISLSEVNNDAKSTTENNNTYVGYPTYDKVFLLSAADYNNKQYGFNTNDDRISTHTDYSAAKSNSTEFNPSWVIQYISDTYLTRSPSSIYPSSAYVIRKEGNMGYIDGAIQHINHYFGVRPAMWLNLSLDCEHTWGEGTIIKEPTNDVEGEIKYLCEICGELKVEELPVLVNKEIEIFEENGIKYINFGSYPQTHVGDETLIAELNKLTETNDRGYYEYHGKEYAKVTTTPFYYGTTSSTDKYGNVQYYTYTYSDGSTINRDVVEWFKVEPIKWRIISENADGSYQIYSEYILDVTSYCAYDNFGDLRLIDGEDVHQNNYKYSNIRAWLNGYNGTDYKITDYTNKGFYDLAFKDDEKTSIIVTRVDNSASTISSIPNSYICEDTNDKMYLLSLKDIENPNYGLSNSDSRRTKVTDFAKAVGACWLISQTYLDCGHYWLRSPYNSDGDVTYFVYYDGYAVYTRYGSIDLNDAFCGVRVACTINLEAN